MADVFLDQGAIERMLLSEEGPVGRALGAAAIRVETQAKLNATGINVEGAENPEGRGPRVRTDNLRSSITWVFGRDELGLFAAVGSNVYYGYYLETGWISSAGNYFKYPFLVPAMSAA